MRTPLTWRNDSASNFVRLLVLTLHINIASTLLTRSRVYQGSELAKAVKPNQPSLVLASGEHANASVAQPAQPTLPGTGRLLLFLGCSLDLNAVKAVCNAAGSKLIWTPGTELITSMPFYYYLAHCDVQDITVAFVFHPGSGAQPYFFLYTQNGGNLNSQQIISHSVADVSRTFGRRPSAIVVDSSIWDAASWWQRRGFPASPFPVPYAEVRQWCQHDVPQFLRDIEVAYPSIPIAFRTAPQVLNDGGFGQMPATIDMMAGCIMGKLWGKYTLIDYYAMAQPTDPKLYDDPLHPGAELSLKYANAALSWVRGL